MEELIRISTGWFTDYCNSFKDLSENHKLNFKIKKDHSQRVAEIALNLSEKLEWSEEERKIAYIIGLLHDVGRFTQLVEFDTFHDEKSVDHAEQAVKILKTSNIFDLLQIANKELVFAAILNHNKFKIQDGLTGQELLHSKILRDADKIDILRVVSEYYSQRKGQANHTLTWELQRGTSVSQAAIKEVMAGKLVSKKNVLSEMDIKVMQLSWVYDLNFKPSFEFIVKNRYLENVYNSLPKNDLVIEVYRKIKVFTENKILS